MVKVFKALSDVNRLKIIELLHSREKCACTLLEEMDIAQSTLSHHLKILVASDIVESRKDGKWTYYALNDFGCRQIKNTLNELINKSDDYISKCDCCEEEN